MITWSPAYETGQRCIDADHKQLIALQNELETAVTLGRGSHVIGHVLDRAEHLLQYHFDRERAALRKMNHDGSSISAAHTKFARIVKDARNRLSGASAAFVSQEFAQQLSVYIISTELPLLRNLRTTKMAA